MVGISIVHFVLAAAMVTLAGRDVPERHVIVVPDRPTPSQVYAAQELYRHVRDMTGVDLSIVTNQTPARGIYLEALDLPPTDDTFRLRMEGDNLHIAGGPRGVLYGVYEVLERFGGCGWFSSWTTVVPKRARFDIPADLNETRKPFYEMREAFFADLRGSSTNADFAARMRINGDYSPLEARHGGKGFPVGANLRSHTFDYLVPAKVYGKDHPEYFAERDGKRVVTENAQHTMQLCLTNPDVIKIATSNLLAAIESDPRGLRFGVFQNDNQFPCTCAKCAAVDAEEGSPAGSMIRFVNAIADCVAQRYPNVIIQTGAYQYTRKPPKTKPRPNVLVELCSIECDCAHPVTTGRYAQNVAFMKDFAGWDKLTKNLFIWSYLTDYNYYAVPFPNVDVLQADLKRFSELGVRYMTFEGSYQGLGADLEALKTWLVAKWMWNPTLEKDVLMRQFCEGFYGAAAPMALQYIRELSACAGPDDGRRLSCFTDTNDAGFAARVSDAFLDRAQAIWERAEKAVAGDAVRLRNVRLSSFATYAALFQRQQLKYGKTAFNVRRTPLTDDVGMKRFHAIARRCADMLAAEPTIRLSEERESREKPLLRDIAEAVKVEPHKPLVRCDRVVLEESSLKVMERDGRWCTVVDEPTALNGRAVKFNNGDYQWCVQLPLPLPVFDADGEYAIRLRVKAVIPPGATASAQAYSSGLCDALTGKAVVHGLARTVGDVKSGVWEWVDLGCFRPRNAMTLWVASGFFDKAQAKKNANLEAFYLDQVEISRVENVRSHGARGDGRTKDTVAIQHAIDAAAADGGGRVVLPAGKYLSGTIYLKDRVELYLDAGAELFASPDPKDYNAADVCVQNRASKRENASGAHLIMAIEKTDVAIGGTGKINGNFAAFLVDPKTGDNYPGRWAGITWRPSQMIAFLECARVTVRDVTLTGSAYWSCFFHGCRNVCVGGLTVRTSRKPRAWNGDGLDVDCCQQVTIGDCDIETDDDCITLRANIEPLKRPQDCAYVTVSNCTLSSLCNAVRIGVGDGYIHDARFSNLRVHDSRTAINIVGGYSPNTNTRISDIRFEDIQVDCGDVFRLHHMRSLNADMGRFSFARITGRQSDRSRIWGSPKHPFGRMDFTDVAVDGLGIEVYNAPDLHFERCQMPIIDVPEVERRKTDELLLRGETRLY